MLVVNLFDRRRFVVALVGIFCSMFTANLASARDLPDVIECAPPSSSSTFSDEYAENDARGRCTLVSDVNAKLSKGWLSAWLTPSEWTDYLHRCMEQSGCFTPYLGTKISSECSEKLSECNEKMIGGKLDTKLIYRGLVDKLTTYDTLNTIVLASILKERTDDCEKMMAHALTVEGQATTVGGVVSIFIRDPNYPTNPGHIYLDAKTNVIIGVDHAHLEYLLGWELYRLHTSTLR